MADECQLSRVDREGHRGACAVHRDRARGSRARIEAQDRSLLSEAEHPARPGADVRCRASRVSRSKDRETRCHPSRREGDDRRRRVRYPMKARAARHAQSRSRRAGAYRNRRPYGRETRTWIRRNQRHPVRLDYSSADQRQRHAVLGET